MNLPDRLHTLKDPDPVKKTWLYRNGSVSPVIGSFVPDGYQYGALFSQSMRQADLYITATSQYNIRGGRTWTAANPIPSACIGMSLHCTGYIGNQSMSTRNGFTRMYLSEAVHTVSDTESVADSGAFEHAAYAEENAFMTETAPGTEKRFHLVLPILKSAYLSLMMYKGNNGTNYAVFQEIWIE